MNLYSAMVGIYYNLCERRDVFVESQDALRIGSRSFTQLGHRGLIARCSRFLLLLSPLQKQVVAAAAADGLTSSFRACNTSRWGLKGVKSSARGCAEPRDVSSKMKRRCEVLADNK